MKILLLAALLSAIVSGKAPEKETQLNEKIDSSVVRAGFAGYRTPVAHTTLSKADLKQASASSSLPMSLATQPSTVTVNEGGTGLGYSSMSIRGVSGSQTSVSLNGITLNDSESQEVFWVNIPSISSFLSKAQVQRGLGTAACGPGAFGASVNMVTDNEIPRFYESSYGSFNTLTNTVSTPILNWKRFKLGFATSVQGTDGYIRNAWADVRSTYVYSELAYRKGSFRLVYLTGFQHTGITWEGIPLSRFLGGEYTYNPAGEYIAPDGSIAHYGNQCDNYSQNHFQLIWKHGFNENSKLETTVNYTMGKGYYEQYRVGFMDDDSDAVTQDRLDNDFYAVRSEYSRTSGRNRLSAGLYGSVYCGIHDGLTLKPVSSDLYYNTARKSELDLWGRDEFEMGDAFSLYAEVQLRMVNHRMEGPDEYGQVLDFEESWPFLNPRVGFEYKRGTNGRVYASVALGHREPSRSDIQASASVKNESMLDFEFGYRYRSDALSADLGLYSMEYYDMLLETGKINDGGYTIKENTPRAWRRGVEVAATWKAGESISIAGNINLSTNKIKEYTAYLDTYDADWNFTGQTTESYKGVSMRMSPSAIAYLGACWKPDWLSEGISIGAKYVGRQYWDNTGSEDRMIPSYMVMDLSAGHCFKILRKHLYLKLNVGNLLNSRYYANAWVWRAFVGGEPYQEEGVFPQAPFNATVSMRLEL